MEHEEHPKLIFKEFLHGEDEKELLEREEAHETIDLGSSMVLSYTPRTNLFCHHFTSPYYVIFTFDPNVKFSSKAHHTNSSQVGCTS